MICPHCGHHNLEGLDNCEKCLQDLRTLDVPLPTGGLQKHLMEDTVGQVPFDRLVTVREVMTPSPEAVEEGDPIRVVINKMSVGGYRHVPIVKGERPVGIISAK